MLTGLAILERELGLVEYERHRLLLRMGGRIAKAEAEDLRRQLERLDERRKRTLELLDERHAEYETRRQLATSAGHRPPIG
jgi:hypothetical protein